MSVDEGYIKFELEWRDGPAAPESVHARLNRVRTELFGYELIGEYKLGEYAGIGFGNVSLREAEHSFWISGTATGAHPVLSPDQFARVTHVDLDRNFCRAEGPVQPSSESMTHAAIYKASAQINAVLHIHSLEHWKQLLGKVPTTRKEVAYGTPEMGNEVGRLFLEGELMAEGFFAMAGHSEGLVGYGKSLEGAMKQIREKLQL